MIPGFVDLQVNGYEGIDFSAPDLTIEKIEQVGKTLLRLGTVAYCPTIITASDAIYERNLPLLARAMDENLEGARILGIHLEGPFLSPVDGARGAHPAQHVRPPSIPYFEQLRERARDRVVLLTLAPETEGAEALIAHATKNSSVVVSLGHTLANAENIRRACDAGARAWTHLGNGLPSLIDRHRNPIWPALAEDRLTCFCISDGYHVPADLLKTCLRVKGPERVIITSDVVLWAGRPGTYKFHALTIVVEENGWIHQEGSAQMAGSGSTMLECMNFLAAQHFLTEDELRLVSFSNPLRLLGRDAAAFEAEIKPAVRLDGHVFSPVPRVNPV